MKKPQPDNKEQIPNRRLTRYLAMLFSVLALTMLIVCEYSYLTTLRVQRNYHVMVSDSMQKLELINRLHHYEDLIYNNVLKHLQSTDDAAMARLEQNIAHADTIVLTDLAKLNKLLIYPGRKKTLDNYTFKRQDYTARLSRLLALSRQHKDKEATAMTIALMPAFRQHQFILSNLGDSISVTTRAQGTQVLQTIDSTRQHYNLMLLAAILITGVATYLIRKVIQQSRQHDKILSSGISERQQLKEALSESKVVYTSLFRNISIPILIFDQKTLKVLEVNKAALEEYGFTRNEFLELSILELQPEKQIDEFKKLISTTDPILSVKPKWKHKRNDGSEFYVDIKSYALPPQNDYLPRIVVVINIDERVRAIEELERREKQLLEISSSIPGAVYQFQLNKKMVFCFPFISDGVRKLFDVSPEVVMADPNVLFSTVHPDDVQTLWNSILQSYQTLQPWELEFRAWQDYNNKYIWLKGYSLPTKKDDDTIIWNGTLIDITSEKEAQEQLVTSEANLRYLLNSSPQAIYLLDSQLQIVAFNTKAAGEVSTLQLKKLQLGESILSFLSPDMADKTIQYHQLALEGKTTTYETFNGGTWHEVAFRPVQGPDQRVLAVALSVQDITEQKLILEAIKHNEMQLARAQELSHIGSWEYDLKSGQITWSDNLYKIYEVTPETFKLTPSSVQQLVHPDDAKLVQESYARASKNREPAQIEHRVISPSGAERTIIQIGEYFYDEYDQPVRMAGTVQDITERKRVEREITEARNLLQSTLENIPEIIFSTDGEFNVTYISPQCLEILGYADYELVGNQSLWTKIVYSSDLEKLHDVMRELFKGERMQYEIRVSSRDGQIRWLLLRLSPTLNEDKWLIRLDGSAADITEHKIAEAKREELHKQVLYQNLNLQQFAYIVSHNLRAPIANILGLTSIYNKNNPEDPINKRVIDNMFKSAKLLDNTIRDLNELLTIRGELQSNLMEELTFASVLDHVTDSLTEEITEAEATIEADFDEAPVIVTLRSYLQSILFNLISNALKYRDADRKLIIKVKTFDADDYICLQVHDNGLGIDLDKEKGKIFGLYRRFHPGVAGKGLGLHLVKTQAELLGGKVEVESNVGIGTIFSVYFLKSSIVDEHIKKSSLN